PGLIVSSELGFLYGARLRIFSHHGATGRIIWVNFWRFGNGC
ncbi:unnamed protein product, partial [Allacma fusca]